jgi:hypothetical protein
MLSAPIALPGAAGCKRALGQGPVGMTQRTRNTRHQVRLVREQHCWRVRSSRTVNHGKNLTTANQ